MIEIALWTEMVDQTYTVQDCVLEFIFKKFNVVMHDETAESALTLNDRLHWHEEVDRKFQNTTFEATFDFRRKRFRVTKSENHACSIWSEPNKGKGV